MKSLLRILLLVPVVAAMGFIIKPLLVVDETRYLAVAWEMWNSGDFLVPHLNGETYAHKPPFLFWLMHLGWSLTGVQEWWPRLLAPLALILDTLLIVRLGKRLWPTAPQTAYQAGILFAGTLFPVLFATGVMFDLWATLWVILGITALADAHQGAHLKRTAPLAMLALGLGILTKGPVLLLYLLPPALAAKHWSGNTSEHWKRVLHTGLLGLAGGAALALCWAIPAAIIGGQEYRDAIFVGQTAGRIENSFDHARPFWWYLPLLPIMLFPWFWWSRSYRGWKQFRAHTPDFARLMFWAIVPQFLVFSLISGKQPHYLLPMFPVLALAFARNLEQSAQPQPSQRSMLLPLLLPAILCLASFSSPLWLNQIHPPDWLEQQSLLIAGGILLLTLFGIGYLARRKASKAGTLSLLSPVLAFTILFSLGQNFRESYDTKPAAAQIALWQEQGFEVGFLDMEYAGQFHFSGRLTRPISNPNGRKELIAWLRQYPQGKIVLVVKRDHPMAYGKPKRPAKQFGSRLVQFWSAAELSAALKLPEGA